MEKERRKRAEECLSLEEEDLKERSIKKPKGVAIEDANMDESMLENGVDNEAMPPQIPQQKKLDFKSALVGRKVVSYKDKLLVLNGEGGASDDEEDDRMAIQRKEEDEEDMAEEEEPEENDDPLCLTYRMSKAEHREDCEKWRSALIVKLLGKKISYKFLIARLVKIWNVSGMFESIELDNGYTLIKFHNINDYKHALHEGPWVISGHYVVVQRWRL